MLRAVWLRSAGNPVYGSGLLLAAAAWSWRHGYPGDQQSNAAKKEADPAQPRAVLDSTLLDFEARCLWCKEPFQRQQRLAESSPSSGRRPVARDGPAHQHLPSDVEQLW